MEQLMTDWRCIGCGGALLGDQPGVPCSQCGDIRRTTSAAIRESVEVLSSIRIQKKSPGYPSRKRIRLDHFEGWDWSRKLGSMVRKLRRVDKDADIYTEVVQERDGTVIHECHEPLSDHRGHGSARQRDPTD